MIKIWIMETNYGSFWKEHGKASWSKDIGSLIRTIKDGYRVRYCDGHNGAEVDWK